MLHWLDYVDAYTVDGLLRKWPDTDYRGWYLGDWAAPKGIEVGEQESVDLINNCSLCQVYKELEGIAKVLGRPEEAAGFKARYDAFAAANIAIAASGTVSLELAMAHVPHLIAYRLNALTAALARRVLKIKYVNLINLLQDKPVIPELLQENCTLEKLTQTAENLFQNPRQDVLPSLEKLGLNAGESPSEKVAACLLKLAREGEE